jgi:hypothetical protein
MATNFSWKQSLLVASIVMGIIAGYRLLTRNPNEITLVDLEPGKIPACESSVARQLLKRAVEQSPHAQQSGLKIIKLGEFYDLTVDKSTAKRTCAGEVFTNAGRGSIDFTLDWMSPKQDEVWLQVTGSQLY